MDCAESVTEAGRGLWGYHETDFVLSTVNRTWRSRYGPRTRTASFFRFTYQLRASMPMRPEVREFETELRRDAFFAASIGTWKRRGGSADLALGCRPLIESWVGRSISAVVGSARGLTFSIDEAPVYLELAPDVVVHGTVVEPDAEGYSDALSQLAGQRITEADVYLDEGIVVAAGGRELRLPVDRIERYDSPDDLEELFGHLPWQFWDTDNSSRPAHVTLPDAD